VTHAGRLRSGKATCGRDTDAQRVLGWLAPRHCGWPKNAGPGLTQAGRTNREIARQLYLTVNMVETHLRHVYAKLAISRRTQLASRSDALTP
jgi:Bacterial regulatory proteins, luxR family